MKNTIKELVKESKKLSFKHPNGTTFHIWAIGDSGWRASQQDPDKDCIDLNKVADFHKENGFRDIYDVKDYIVKNFK